MHREEFLKMTLEERIARINENSKRNAENTNNQIDKFKMAYKIKDTDGNIFVFGGVENGFPLYRTNGGCKHIYDLNGMEIVEKYLVI